MKFHPQEIKPDPLQEKIDEVKKHLANSLEQYIGMPMKHPPDHMLRTIEEQALQYITQELPGAENYLTVHALFDPRAGKIDLQLRVHDRARIKFLREPDDTRLGSTFKEIP